MLTRDKNGAVTMLWSLIRILRASLVQIDTEMAEKYAKQQPPAVCGKFAFGRYVTRCVSALMDLVTLSFDFETGMRVASKVGNLPSEYGHARPLGSRITRYVGQRDGRRDKRTEKSKAYCLLPYGWGNKRSK